jgi:ABC-2 type transport system permease protein
MDKSIKETPEKLFDISKIVAIIKKNYIVLSRDYSRLLPALLFPIVIMLVLGYATGNVPKHIPTVIVIHDESPLSQSLVQAISGSQYFKIYSEVSTDGEARQLLDSGKAKVIVVIPPGLEDNLDNNKQSAITVIVDESDSAIAQTSRTILQTTISRFSSQLSEQKLKAYQFSVSSSAQRLSLYINNFQCSSNTAQFVFPINYQLEDYKNNVESPLLSIQLFSQADSEHVLQPIVYEEKPAYGIGKQALDFVLPALIAMTLFQGAVMGMGRAVAGEKKEGSLTRVFLTPTSNITIITGTLLFYIIFEMIRASFLVLVSIILFSVIITGNILLIAFILLIYVSIAASIGMLISVIVKTESQFQGIALLISLPVLFLSGVFFPVQAMPKFLQAIAQVLPVTYAADALRSVMVKGLGINYIMFDLGILLAFLVVLLTLTIIMFRRDIE